MQPRPYNTLCVFFSLQEPWWFFGASCRLISGQNRVKYLTRPRGRGETWASSSWKGRGSSWNCDFSRAAPYVHLQVRPQKPHSTQSCACREQGDSIWWAPFVFLMWIVQLLVRLFLKGPFADSDRGTAWIRVSTLKPGRLRPLAAYS